MNAPSRRPAVSGMFYPSRENELRALIDALHSQRKIDGEISTNRILGLVVPHAGYVYSGRTALSALQYLSGSKHRRFVMIGPNHDSFPPYSAIYPEGRWKTPMGSVSVDTELCESLMASLGELIRDPDAHRREHSLEVQLPLMQYILGNDFTICPIIMGNQEIREAVKIGETLSRIRQDFTVIVSSDLTHYEALSSAKKKDHELIDSIVELDVEAFYSTLRKNRVTACGYGAIGALIQYTKMKGGRIYLVDYSTSYDKTRDESSVVGYASLIAYK